jgi:hypothetical protein
MRVMAGQVLHRDFYYNYGPGSVYLLAGLFKVFGPSVLVARSLSLCSDSLLVLSVYAMSRRLSRPNVALAAAVLCIMWLFSIGSWSLLNVVMLWATWIIARAFEEDLPRGWAFAAGVLVGLATLLRYDMGIALAGCHLVTVAIGIGLRQRRVSSWFLSMVRSLWAYAVAMVIVVAPALWVYLRVAPMHDLLFDIVLYTAKYYRVARNLPFPWRHVAQLQEMVVYVVAAIMLLSLYMAGRRFITAWREGGRAGVPRWVGATIALVVIAGMTYAKGLVRISAVQVATSAVVCMVLCAALYERREMLSPWLRKSLVALIGLFYFLTAWAGLHQLSSEHKFKSSMLLWIVEPTKEDVTAPFNTWCQDRNSVTRGACYLMDSDHIETVEFLEAHTHPGDTLYVGLPQHDRILINDNMTYFAVQRLPATKWSHFDPFLQSLAPAQKEMIADLERNKPPYVVLDSEFDAAQEPNGSSVHTGVHLLDNYIGQRYRLVKTFGEMTILQRDNGLGR